LFVSIYGKADSKINKNIIESVEKLKRKRRTADLNITYYNAESANVWG